MHYHVRIDTPAAPSTSLMQSKSSGTTTFSLHIFSAHSKLTLGFCMIDEDDFISLYFVQKFLILCMLCMDGIDEFYLFI